MKRFLRRKDLERRFGLDWMGAERIIREQASATKRRFWVLDVVAICTFIGVIYMDDMLRETSLHRLLACIATVLGMSVSVLLQVWLPRVLARDAILAEAAKAGSRAQPEQANGLVGA